MLGRRSVREQSQQRGDEAFFARRGSPPTDEHQVFPRAKRRERPQQIGCDRWLEFGLQRTVSRELFDDRAARAKSRRQPVLAT